jgi:hypothetical protein
MATYFEIWTLKIIITAIKDCFAYVTLWVLRISIFVYTDYKYFSKCLL